MGDGGRGVKERPILFKGSLVRAILEGRKTVTRRVITKLGDHSRARLALMDPVHGCARFVDSIPDDPAPVWLYCPHGAEGDRLWVRESFQLDRHNDNLPPREAFGQAIGLGVRCDVRFRADNALWNAGPQANGEFTPGRCRPSLHMLREFSRIDLEITSVRAERLQEIEREDPEAHFDYDTMRQRDKGFEREGMEPAVQMDGDFRHLWDDINGKLGPDDDPEAYSWARNPWVWRLEFRRVRP